jgi:lipopolysaccharide transport system ATP-binding protein
MSRSSEIIHPSSDVDSDVLIRVNNVSKKFCRDFKKSLWYGLKDTAGDIFRLGARNGADHDSVSLRPSEFWANQNVSFEVKRGECLGLIGHNGAGKTTLLKMLNGLIKPDTGSIEMHGRIGALIALGAGFNPILTGRENVYVNGSILGLSKKQIDAKLDDIVDFAEVKDSIDAPVRTYSSGMQVRLGFAVAVILTKPDVLILDEVLAVGDIGFTIKCLNIIREKAAESAVILVSHSMQMISSFCDSAIHLGNGSIIMGPTSTSECIDSYASYFENPMVTSGKGGADISNIKTSQEGAGTVSSSSNIAVQGLPWNLELDLHIDPPNESVAVKVYIMDESLLPIIELPLTNPSGGEKTYGSGKHHLNLNMGILDLNSGKYCLTIACVKTDDNTCLMRKQGCFHFQVSAPQQGWAKVIRPIVASP